MSQVSQDTKKPNPKDEIQLPKELLQYIKTKSTKKKGFQFDAKLHKLLDFVEESPDKRDEAGCRWMNESEFSIEKKTAGKSILY
jgi:hypothetical protein